MLELDISLSPSKLYNGLLLSVSVGCLAIIGYLPIMAWIKIILIFFVLIYSGYIVLKYGLLELPSSVTRLVLYSDDWRVVFRKQMVKVQILGESTVTSWVSVIRFRIPGKFQKYSCVIFRDSLSGDEYRRLLVALKCRTNKMG